MPYLVFLKLMLVHDCFIITKAEVGFNGPSACSSIQADFEHWHDLRHTLKNRSVLSLVRWTEILNKLRLFIDLFINQAHKLFDTLFTCLLSLHGSCLILYFSFHRKMYLFSDC